MTIPIKKKGFTLVEIMLVVAIMGIILIGLFGVMAQGESSWKDGTTRLQCLAEARRALDVIQRELRTSGSSTISGLPADGAWYDTITFKRCIGISGSSAQFGSDITYTFANSQILSNTTRVLANDISYLGFSRDASNLSLIKIRVTASRTTYQGRLHSTTLNGIVKMRN